MLSGNWVVCQPFRASQQPRAKWRLFLTFLLISLSLLISKSSATRKLTFESPLQAEDDETLPMYVPRSWPHFPSSYLLSSHHDNLKTSSSSSEARSERRRRHHGGRRHRRQFTFASHTSSNVSLGHGDPGSGPWGPWSELSECTRSCGLGVQYQTRLCMEKLTPNACVGPSKRYFSCSYEECPPGSADFRSDQCSRFNSIPFEGEYHEWIPYTKVANPCELHCRPKGRNFYVRQSRKVIDGTRCHSGDPGNICVEGVCVALSCDRSLGSSVTEDRCGVCGGNGATCRTVSATISGKGGLVAGYNDILLIPAGATNIAVREVVPTNNYLAVRSSVNGGGRFYLNGDWHIAQPQTLSFAGTKWVYSKSTTSPEANGRQAEQLTAKGPTSEALLVVLLVQEENGGIAYEYSVPFTVHSPAGSEGGVRLPPVPPPVSASQPGQYVWISGDYGACSRTCGTGIQRRAVLCATTNERTGAQEPAAEALCDVTTRPADSRPCFNEAAPACPPLWFAGNWSTCSCVTKTQTRPVFCTSGGLSPGEAAELESGSCSMLPDSACGDQSGAGPRPDTTKTCQPTTACPDWITGSWSACDVGRCGEGRHNRTVKCGYYPNGKTLKVQARKAKLEVKSFADEPEVVITMQKRKREAETESSILAITTEASIGVEVATATTVLSVQEDGNSASNTESSLFVAISDNKIVEEDETTKEPEVVYVDSWLCNPETKPKEVDRCFSDAPCDEVGSVEWITSAWTSCDVDCGPAVSTRNVVCSTRDGTVWEDDACIRLRGAKPEQRRICSERSCSKSLWFTGEWSSCSVKCGKGIQTRTVFCGHLEEGTGKVIPDEDESKCGPASSKPLDSGVCIGVDTKDSKECPGHWLTGPLGPCTLSCGGGQRKRPIFCMHQDQATWELSVVNETLCPAEEAPSKSEQCNVESCNEEALATGIACRETENGCCPNDGSTPAEEDYRNCPRVLVGINETSSSDVTLPSPAAINCKEVTFGCCHGETSYEAFGPFDLGCPLRCGHTEHGCCDDNVTVAEKADRSDCPVESVFTTSTTVPPPLPTTTQIPLAASNVEFSSLNTEPPSKCSSEADVEGSGDSQPDCIKSVTSIPVVDCKTSKFGCCPDGWTDASGPNGDGCDLDGSGDNSGLLVTTISSLLSGIFNTVTGITGSGEAVTTERVWPETDDCNLTEFGCCPNGRKKATGPRYYGCTCEDYPYGCCQDRFSPASGENYAGCQCDRMLYGCCADGSTPATGPDQDGCNCASSTYGCCSDMVTTARGPNFAGCPCDTLTYGCCPGSTDVPARGPNFGEGCTCAVTPFGCCADGSTVAYGPKFEGCPSGPQLDLKLASEVCSLPMAVGGCRNFTVKWYFDVAYGSCNRFWYGGCEGNGNRFSSQELCERACVKPEGPERCALPKISGPCNASVVAWQFDGTGSRRCERFIYGGCLGNTNRFESQQQCEEHCVYQEKALDRCEQPVSPGPCQGNYRRWYYRKEEGRCREFYYGGCQGNLNNFPSEAECSNACAQQTPFEICALPKAEGPCLGNFPRWHFDQLQQGSGVCREFTYSGCEGNKNRFVDRESCERLCNQTITYTYEPNQRLPAPAPEPDDPNSIYSDRYESVCALPKSEGPCREQIIQWWFNSVNGRCERFYYGGCDGNANRFNDAESCEHRCLGHRTRPTYTEDPCLEPKDSGQCQDYSERWYYDVEDRRCHRFYFSGCGGNRNNYHTLDECSARCERPRINGGGAGGSSVPTPTPVEAFQVQWCFKNFDSGPCQNNKIRWYYDRRDGGCKEFIYGGCSGNENRFESQLECETKCWNSQDICKLSPARGSCSLNFTQWYFDDYTKECYEFQFSGCHGNANRFSSREECDQQCRSPNRQQQQATHHHQQQPHHQQPQQQTYHPQQPRLPPTAASEVAVVHQRPVPEHCRLPRDPGPCQAYIRSWYFSAEHSQCLAFVYGGCQGNKNRYSTRDACEQACTSSGASPEDEGPMPGDNREIVCRLPAESGPCQETTALWFYDSNSHTCLPFAYGGCRGNKNRFPSYEHCIGFCGGVQSRDLTPTRAPTPPSSYYPPNYPVQQPQPQQPSQPQPPQPPPSSPPEDCEAVRCEEEQCPLGIDYFTDSRGCYACRCTNPCYELHCPDDMNCALEMYRDENGKPRGHAECRLRTKPGGCPSAEDVLAASPAGPHLNGTNCLLQCRTDADCRGADKCCSNGCANVCFSIFGAPEIPPYMQPQYPPRPHVYPQPQSPPQQQPQQPQPPSREPAVDADGGFSYDPNSNPDLEPGEQDPYLESGPYGDPNAIHVPTAPVVEQVVTANEKTVLEVSVTVDAGADALLNCELPATKEAQRKVVLLPSSVVWSRDGRQVVDKSLGEQQLEKYEQSALNGSLLIRRTDFADHGTYACVGDVVATEEGAGEGAAIGQSETAYVKLQVRAPVQIRPGPTNVIAMAGMNAFLQCNAIGFPDPKVTWWRGDRSLPLRSFKYEQLSNYTLVIRRMGGRDGGVYTCNAFNGIGQAALWDVTLLLDSKPVEADGVVEYNRGNGGVGQASVTHKPTSYLDRIGAEVSLSPPTYKIGSTLELRCEVRSQITGEVINPTLLSSVSWYVPASPDIPLAQPTANVRFRLLNGNSTLVLYHLAKADSGEYRCRASTGPYAEAAASVLITVDNIYVPNECQDSPSFTNCEMIVASNYCSNSFYNKFCCRSCYIADVKAGRIREAAAA